MNVLVIPSWYPSDDFPITGIFFKEQTMAMAKLYPEVNFGISLWGSHDKRLWLDVASLKEIPRRILQRRAIKSTQTKLLPNCTEYFDPAFTWSREVLSGNIRGIIAANLRNAERFQAEVGKIDVIHAHVGYPAGYIAHKSSEMIGCPYIISEHMGPFPFDSLKKKSGQLIQKLQQAYKNAQLNTAVSHSLKVEMKAFGIDTVVLHNFIDHSIFEPISASHRKKIIFVGRVIKHKGIFDLLNAWKVVSQEYPNNILEIIGEAEGEFIPTLIVEGIKNVHFSGPMGRDKIVKAIQDSDFLVLPSHLEPFGVVLIEAMACGKPAVATRCGGPEDIVTERVGLLAKPKDPADLAAKMMEMIRSLDQYDPEVIRAEFLGRFSAKKIGEEWIKVYERVSFDFNNKKA